MPRIGKFTSGKTVIVQDSTEELTDMVIAFDTTGSMASYIKSVKAHVTKLIPQLFKDNPNLKISIVAFGDYCDMRNKDNFGKAYQVCELTDNENKLIQFVKNAKNTSGGDGDEFYELVIKKITEETAWREGSNRTVLLIADASPHRVGYSYRNYVQNNQIDWKVEAARAAKIGIKFDTLRISSYVKWYQTLSKMTGGVCLEFSNSNKTSKLIRATSLARGGAATRDTFIATMTSDAVLSDKEISEVYTAYSKEVL